MKRREMFGALAGLFTLPVLAHASKTQIEKLGPMTPDRYQNGFKQSGYRIFAGNEDITDRCRYVDDIEQIAICHLRDENGNLYLDESNEIATETIRHGLHWKRIDLSHG